MRTLKTITVPTGHILVVKGKQGKLECLSLGDYGKDVNIKCNAMGLTREPSQVRHTQLLPLKDKWVITVSTQYGCTMGCTFCDVPKVGPGINATIDDLIGQVKTAMALHPEVTATKRLNIHYARMGEPTWNSNVIGNAWRLHKELNGKFNVHPVVSTMMPKKNKNLRRFIDVWMRKVKNGMYEGNAGLQLSINSTDELERKHMFNDNALTLHEIADIMDFTDRPIGRKIILNFAIAGYEIDPAILKNYFDPKYYLIKLTPMHKTAEALTNGIATEGDYTTFHPYKKYEDELTAAGYDVLVFIASHEEDASRITCGNAILSGTMPECAHTVKDNE